MIKRFSHIVLLVVLAVPVLLTSCIGASVPSLPVINSFNSTPAAVADGSPAVLDWNVSNATALIIDQGVGSVSSSGTSIVTPVATTTYTLTAVNAAGAVTKSLTVTVNSASVTPVVPVTPVPSGPLPVASFTVNPGGIIPNGTAVLNWSVANASNVVIDHGIGPVAVSGSRAVSPNVTTDYTLTASNAVGAVTSMVRLVVAPVGSLPPANPPGNRDWLGSTYTLEYHWPSCSIAQNIPAPSRRWFDTVNQAIANGYHPCPVCHPPR
jgi:cytoskeletal protein RodZ